MTSIKFRQAGKHFIATFSGHTNAPRVGDYDQVCTAVSILSQTLLSAMQDAQARGHLAKDGKLKRNDSDASISVDVLASAEGYPYVLGAFSAIFTGCALLEKEYPQFVSLGRNFEAYPV